MGRARTRRWCGGGGALLVLGCQSSSVDPPTDDASPRRPSSTASSAAVQRAGASPSALPSSQRPAPAVCPDDMVEVEGIYCTDLEHTCLEARQPWQCATFAEGARCVGDEIELRFCIDRFESPNREGHAPDFMVSWLEAKAACEARERRLCTESEWTLACEGPGRWAYPYGFVRDATRCNIDRPTRYFDLGRLFHPFHQQAELARIDQREPSGSRPGCVSAFGVHDLTGNVDEWVVNESGRPYPSSLKGGNWEQHRNACRPVTQGHQPGFSYYPTGFRCCSPTLP